jgi:putative membrane-bound dehydrogenase-like protein
MRLPDAILAAILLGPLASATAAQEPAAFRVGAARIDVTPDAPIRLSGYGGRRAESDGVVQRLYARALAVDDGRNGPAVLITVDNVGVPAWLVEQTAVRLAREIGLPRERLVIASTHTHTGPMLRDSIPNMFGTAVPSEHQERIDRYSELLGDHMVEAARAAVRALQPGHIFQGRGSVPFAANRRTAGGPVDHELPFLAARAADGALVALVANYACHCTTLGGHDNFICGDWAGYAAEALELDQKGAVALITIGCGADANPASFGLEQAQAHGRALANEVGRLLAGATPLAGPLQARLKRERLPFDRLPTHAEWQARLAQGGAVAYHAQKNLDRLERGESLPTELEYPIATWTFGEDLALVFLAGEVVVDYSLRLKREFDAARLWITAYANDVPCYIPSERILREGGYEAEGAMVYYDRPTRLRAGVEQQIVDAVRAQLPAAYRTVLGVDVSRTEGVAPKTPEQARAALVVRAGLRAELVAAEPLVASPVALDFGPDGSLWVCEMRDYPSGMDGEGAPGGRVSVLRDTDGDGRPDRRSTFLEAIPFPTGVTVWRDGALICASNDILYAADRDGDGRADEVRVLYSGFRTDNFQARVNSLEIGLDGWIYGASGLPTGTITSFSGASLELGGRDFRIHPDSGAIEAVSGLTQQGRCRDDFGGAFGCDNGTILRHYPLEERYLRRNPHVVPPPASVLVPRDPDANRLFPVSPILARFNEPDAAGRVTSGCGVGLYRDDLLGSDFAGNSFTCEPVHNLVTRLVLRADGASFAGERAAEESDREFLASTDPWFRPVQVRTGPDGALYVVDMARFVIEHPAWIPEERLAHLDVRAGADMGRIWRIVPEGRPLRASPRLDELTGATLAAALDSPNGTVRDLVQARLVALNGAAPLQELRALARSSAHPAAVAQALSVLQQLGSLRAEDLLLALAHSHPGVRRNAVRLSETLLDQDATLFDSVAALAEDQDLKVRMQVACSLGESARVEAGARIAMQLLDLEQDPHLRAAWLSSALPHLGSILTTLLILQSYGAAPDGLTTELVSMAVQTGDQAALTALRNQVATDATAGRWSAALELAATCLAAADRQGASFPGASQFALLRAPARRLAADPAEDPDQRTRALLLLGRDLNSLPVDLQILDDLLDHANALELQAAAVATLARVSDPRAGAALLAAWDRLGPALRPAALDALFSREIFLGLLLDALPSRPDLAAALDAARRAQLLDHPVPELRARAAALLSAPPDADRQQVLARYAGVSSLAGNPARGAASFAQNCALCHRLDGVGANLGPDLAALSDRSPESLLVAILDPSRAINPEYVNYLVSTRDGRHLAGLIRGESAGSLRLLTLTGAELELMRSNVLTITDTRASLMPVGLESVLSPHDMADLIAYLQAAGAQPKSFPGNQPGLVHPGEDGSLTLAAAQAGIFGDSLVFEAPFQNLGYWSSSNDHAVWEMSVESAGEWEVLLDYACAADAAGNRLFLQIGSSVLTHEVAGTGGWSQYRTISLGRLTLPAGPCRVMARAAGEIRGALLDLRALRLLPPGTSLSPISPSTAAPSLAALIEGLQPGTAQEYERIPGIWQVAIAAGRGNDPAELHALLEASLPVADEPLRHWQVVVVGGGLINGLTQVEVWPRERLREVIGGDAALAARLERTIELAAEMARDPAVPPGTRYDALRLLGISNWDAHGVDLLAHLRPDADPELQMGAVSGLGDLADPRAWDALRAAMDGLTAENRALAEAALRRVPSLEQCLASGFDLWGELALRQPGGPSFDFFADLLPPLRYVNTAFRHYPIVLGAPDAPIKARFVSNGSGVNLLAGISTWRDEGLIPVSFHVGPSAAESFGQDLDRLEGPRLAEGWLPIVELSYSAGSGSLRQEAFAQSATDDAVVFLRFTADGSARLTASFGGAAELSHAAGLLRQTDGRVLARHGAGFDFDSSARSLVAELSDGESALLALPTRGASDTGVLDAPRWEAERANCVAAWSNRLAGAARVITGEPRVDQVLPALLAGTLQLAQGDVLQYSHGNLYETTFEAECGDAARALMAWGVPGSERFVPPLLERPLQGGVFLNDVAFKLQLCAWAHFFRRDAAWTRAQLPALLAEAERALAWIDAVTGLVPAQAYCGDIQTPCDNLYANAAFWRGLRDLALTLEDLGGAEAARAAPFAAAAAALQERILQAVTVSERLDQDPPFVPVALFGLEQPYGLLTETMQGAYWNLVAPFVYDSGVFGPHAQRTAAMVSWQLRRGGLFLGMSRFHQHSGLFANEDAVDDLYTLRLVEDLLKRDEADRALVSFYGKLAQGMTRDTCIGGEGTGLRPLDALGRGIYLPPNAAANAFFLLTLRHLLVQDFDRDADGRADALRLLFATPRAWLADGGLIRVEGMPTFFGPVSLEVRSELARGRVLVSVDLPTELSAPALIKLRLPAPYERTDGAGEIIELAAGVGPHQFEVAVRPSSR